MAWVLGALWISGCGRREEVKAPAEPEWVVSVGTSQLTPDGFRREWERRVRQREAPIAREEALSAVVDEWIAFEAARSTGFLDTDEMRAEWRRLAGTRYREQQMERIRGELGPADVSEQGIRSEYEASPDRWERPEARLIGCFSASLPARASEDRRREIRAMVEGWRESVRTNAEPVSSFAELCRRHSEDAATRYFGGESGWLTRPQWAGRWGGAAGDAIGGLSAVGEVTSIVESGGLLLFFQLRGVRERSVRPLGEVAGILRAERIRRWEDAVSRAVAADLASSIQVRTNQLALEGVEAPVPENPAAAPPPQMIEY